MRVSLEWSPSIPSQLHSRAAVAAAAAPLLCRTYPTRAVIKLMEMHGDNTTEDIGMEMEREDEEGAEVVAADE